MTSTKSATIYRLTEVVVLLCEAIEIPDNKGHRATIGSKMLFLLGSKSKTPSLIKYVSKLNPDSSRFDGGYAYNLVYGYSPMSSNTAMLFYAHGAKEHLRSYLLSLESRAMERLELALSKYWFEDSEKDAFDRYIELLFRSFRQIYTSSEPLPFTRVELQEACKSRIHDDLMSKFGEELYSETGDEHLCPKCGINVLVKNGPEDQRFQIAVISSDESVNDAHNLIALCPSCFESHIGNGVDSDSNTLIAAKDRILRLTKGASLLSRMPIDGQIKAILISLNNDDDLPIEEISIEWNAVMIKKKLMPKKHLISEIEGLVAEHRQTVLQVIQGLDKNKTIHGMSVAKKIKAKFEKLDKEFSKRILELPRDIRVGVIWRDLFQYLMKISGCEEDAAKIVVAYYIQDCEVFRANP